MGRIEAGVEVKESIHRSQHSNPIEKEMMTRIGSDEMMSIYCYIQMPNINFQL